MLIFRKGEVIRLFSAKEKATRVWHNILVDKQIHSKCVESTSPQLSIVKTEMPRKTKLSVMDSGKPVVQFKHDIILWIQ